MTTRLTQAAIWRALKAHMPLVHWTRIETTTGNGVPDVEGCYQGVAVWIEIKSVGKYGDIDLTPVQCAWHRARAKAGGRSVILAAEHGHVWVWRGKQAMSVATHGTNTPADLVTLWPPYWQGFQTALFRIGGTYAD